MIIVSIVDERARGAALGAAAYLVKPVSRDALLQALRAVGVVADRRGGESMNPGRILVVEDNPKNLKLVRDVLQILRVRGDRGDLG